MAIDPKVLRVARAVARERMAQGAKAVVLTESHVSGRAHAHSDIDLVAIAGTDAWSGSLRRGGLGLEPSASLKMTGSGICGRCRMGLLVSYED